jgi:hypothetical protein
MKSNKSEPMRLALSILRLSVRVHLATVPAGLWSLGRGTQYQMSTHQVMEEPMTYPTISKTQSLL